MNGHILMFDGVRLGLTPESTFDEVHKALKNIGVGLEARMHSSDITIMFDYKNYYFKDRYFGRCDFNKNSPPENPICGE